MGEFIVFERDASFILDVVWQSSLFLLAGLAGGLILGRRPARAHRVLLLAIVGALITPLCGQLVRRAGWGLWATHSLSAAPPRARSTDSATSLPASGVQNRVTAASRHAMSAVAPLPDASSSSTTSPSGSAGSRQGAEARSRFLDRLSFRAIARIRFPNALISLWWALSGLLVVRLVVSMIRGQRLVSRARPIGCQSIEHSAAAACQRLGLRVRPELRASPGVDCPAIWCWGRRPVIVVPEGAGTAAPVDWAGVFCHELAHWVRRDQWSSLLGELLIAALPWHPLAWWAKHRLGQLSELACDDWVLGTGVPAVDYAESLLGLVPQRGASLALAAVSGRRGLVGRIQHILDQRRSSPVVGKRWACASAMAVVLAASALALAQSRPAVSKDQSTRTDETEKGNASKTASVSNQSPPKTRTIRGTVLGPDGKPFSGAAVFWVGERKPPVSFVAMPKDVGHSRLNQTDVIARAMSDSSGRFSLSADFDPDRYVRYNGWDVRLLARAPRAGMVSEAVKSDATEVTLKLAVEVVIRGRLLTPSGMPAAGARVTLTGFTGFPEDKPRTGMHLGLTQTDDEIPPYWPQPRKTDADGRFTYEGVPRGAYATLAFWHPDFAVDEVTVNTTSDGAVPDGLRSFEIVPVPPDFTHALEPARPVHGRVTDKETGKPLAGMLVEVIPMRSHGGMPFQTRTDADGRYRVSGHQAEQFYMNVYPPADSGYLSQSDRKEGWPAGAKFIEKDYALEKGRIVHGQVTDAGTRQPIASAAVVYQPKRGNPNNTGRGYEFRNTVLTDKDGRFAITTLPGQGVLAVETPDENYIRVLLKESYRGTAYPQGSAAIDVPKEGDPKPAAIEVRKGVTLEAQAIGPDGQVVREITGFCKGIDATLIDVWDKAQPFDDGVFRLKGADPNKTYRVFFLQYQRRLGAVTELKYDPRSKGPVEVRLEPTARVHGEIVKPGGSPAMGGQILPYLLLDQTQTELKSTDVLTRENALITVQLFPNEGWSNFFEKCRVQGKFQFEHLIAGARYGLSVRGGNLEGLAAVPPLEPGEDRDLGTISLKERKP